MAQEFAKSFYNSAAWKKCRRAYIEERRMIDGGMCEVCHQRLGYIVHHKIILTRENIHNPEVTLNHKHLSYECKLCHDSEEGHFHKAQVNALFDENGNPIDIREI